MTTQMPTSKKFTRTAAPCVQSQAGVPARGRPHVPSQPTRPIVTVTVTFSHQFVMR